MGGPRKIDLGGAVGRQGWFGTGFSRQWVRWGWWESVEYLGLYVTHGLGRCKARGGREQPAVHIPHDGRRQTGDHRPRELLRWQDGDYVPRGS